MTDRRQPGLVLARAPNSTTGYKYAYRGKPGCGAFRQSSRWRTSSGTSGTTTRRKTQLWRLQRRWGRRRWCRSEGSCGARRQVAGAPRLHGAGQSRTRTSRRGAKSVTKAHRKAREPSALARAEKKASRRLPLQRGWSAASGWPPMRLPPCAGRGGGRRQCNKKSHYKFARVRSDARGSRSEKNRRRIIALGTAKLRSSSSAAVWWRMHSSDDETAEPPPVPEAKRQRTSTITTLDAAKILGLHIRAHVPQFDRASPSQLATFGAYSTCCGWRGVARDARKFVRITLR